MSQSEKLKVNEGYLSKNLNDSYNLSSPLSPKITNIFLYTLLKGILKHTGIWDIKNQEKI